MAANLSPEEEERARRRKNRQDPNQPEKTGGAKPTNVRTEEMDLQEVKDKPGKGSGKKDACYNKVKSRYDVWPSAYASGALVKCRKVGAANWGNSTNEEKDHEYSMARSELSTIIAAAKRLKKKMGKGEGNIEAWVQSKITKAADYIDTAADYVESGEHNVDEACWVGYKQIGMKKKGKRMVPNCVKEGYSNWRQELEEDWQKVNKSDKTDGMSPAAVKAYRRENPGSKLKTAVTGDPKPGSKDSKRRKSFCARSKGQQDMHNIDCSKTPDKAICKARRRWKC
jgi:hypothetical protein